jgi:hypothetical protein
MDAMIIRIGLVALVGLAVLIALASIPSRGKRERNAVRATRSHPHVVRNGSRPGDGGYHGAFSVGHDSGGGWGGGSDGGGSGGDGGGGGGGGGC